MNHSVNLRLSCLVLASFLSVHADILLHEDFERPDAWLSSSTHYGATFAVDSQPAGGRWIGSTRGFGAKRRGLIHRSFGDFTAPQGNLQAYYFGYTNSGLTTSEEAISHVLETGMTYRVAFDVARDNDKISSSYTMELVAFAVGEDDGSRTDVRSAAKPGTVLASVSGTVETNDLTQREVIVFTPGVGVHDHLAGYQLGLRFIGNSSHPILDNVRFSVLPTGVPDDDADGLPDSWETTYFGGLSRDGLGDADGDGWTDAEEHARQTDPNVADPDAPGGEDPADDADHLSVEAWHSLPAIPSVLALQQDGIALRRADHVLELPDAQVSHVAAGIGMRVRALLTPSVSGTYTLHISGANAASLWLSPGDSRFEKQRVAWLHEPTRSQQWNKYPSQSSAPVELTAGSRYYLEAQVMVSQSHGHVALGWTPPGNQAPTLIPLEQLVSVPADPDDVDDNHLPDSWQADMGLNDSGLAGALSEFGDPDRDGRTNLIEYQHGTDPLNQEVLADGLTLETWRGVGGASISHLTHTYGSRFFTYPSEISHAPEIDFQNLGSNFGRRYRGYLVPPVTGTYQLWIAGDDACELWLADGSVSHPDTGEALRNPSGKRRVAHHGNTPGPYRDYDRDPAQSSGPIQLEAGQAYYIEILHKGGFDGKNHLSLAWQAPGEARGPIPATALQGYALDAADIDDDSLPDAWELNVGLNPADNGLHDSREGQFGDDDGDGLTNLREFQLGTDPRGADTDGDGLSDADEINYYGTNPLVANLIDTTLAGTIDLTSPVDSSVAWQTRDDGSILAYERRGWTDWTFTVLPGAEGIHEIRLTGGAGGSGCRSTENLPLSFHLNDSLIARQTLVAQQGENTTMRQLTPWLSAGTHTLRIQNHNVRADCNLRINAIEIHRLGGTDANSNGLADWAEEKFHNENQLTHIPTESLTSPAFIEGVTSTFSSLRLTRRLPTDAEANVQPALQSIDHGFYADIPLDPDAPTSIEVAYEDDTYTTSHEITWAATNVLAHDTLAIRRGDSLRLTAHAPDAPASGSFTLSASAGAPAVTGGSHAADRPVVLTFDAAGTHTYTATWVPEHGEPQTNTLSIRVRAADFGPDFIVQTWNRRTWTLSGLEDTRIEADSALYWYETTAVSEVPRSFLVKAFNAENTHVIARIPETGEILARGTVHAFSLSRSNMTSDAQLVERRPDGSGVYRFTMVSENLPSNVSFNMFAQYQGTIFSSGSRNHTVYASDFSSNGIANIYMETSADTPRICHYVSSILDDEAPSP